MSFPPYDPSQYPQQNVDYYSDHAAGGAARHIKLAIIFNYISAGLDLLGCLILAGLSVLMFLNPSPAANDPPGWLMGSMFVLFALVMMSVAVVKCIAARKLQTCGRGAWGWALAAGICGAAQFLCGGLLAVPQIGAGIYTIVVSCMQDVKKYLAMQPQQNPPR